MTMALKHRFSLAGWLLSFAGLLTCGTLVAQEPAVTPTLLRAYTLSKTAASIEQFSELIAACEAGLAEKPSPENVQYARQLLSWAHNRRGELRAAAGEDESAFADFGSSIEFDPKAWRALHNRGVSFAERNQFTEAAADFDRVVQLKPEYPNVYFNRGELRSALGDWRSAIEDFNRALQLKPNDAPSLTSRGYAFYQLRDSQRAMADYSRAIALDPQAAAPRVHRAAMYGDARQWAEAADDYRAAIRIDPRHGPAYQASAWLLATCPDARFRDPKLAVQAARRAIELDGDFDYRYLDTLAAALASDGQWDEAVEAEKKAIAALAPDDQNDRPQLTARLKLYEQKQVYREP